MSNVVCIIADTHFGSRSDNPFVQKYFNTFYQEVFLPAIDQYNVDHVIHCGDLVDRRKFINFGTAMNLYDNFSGPLSKRGVTVDIIVGNHDVSHKNSNKVNALSVLNLPSNCKYYLDPEEVTIKGTKVLMLPWINTENYEQSIEMIRQSNAKYIFGHLQLVGFEMHKGHVADEGLNTALFSKYDHVYTGHFHHRSTIDNITYVGAPYEMMWTDYNDDRGFTLLDLDSGKSKFFKNPNSLFHRIIYNESKVDLKQIDYSKYKNSYVKVVIEEKQKQHLFEAFIDKLERVDPIDIQVVDQTILAETNMVDIDIDQVEDTLSILTKYLDTVTMQTDKQLVKKALIGLYSEACQIDKE